MSGSLRGCFGYPVTTPYPWQQEQWQRLARAGAGGRLPHALLLAAPSGTGLSEFAVFWSRARLCRASGDTTPCGVCPSCEQLRAGTHPDLVRLAPEEDGKAIGVDAVRALIERLSLTAGAQGKIALIDPADSMTLPAANSLLKTLEEPPGGSIMVLVSCRPSRLPATVRSRCQKVAFGLPPRETALDWLRDQAVDDPEYWLARAAGAPLRAQRLATEGADDESLIDGLLQTLERGAVMPSLIEKAGKHPLDSTLPLFASVIADVLRVRVAGSPAEGLHHPGHLERMQRLALRLDERPLFDYLDELNRAVPGPSSSLRPDMQVQGLLADAAALGRSAARYGGGR